MLKFITSAPAFKNFGRNNLKHSLLLQWRNWRSKANSDAFDKNCEIWSLLQLTDKKLILFEKVHQNTINIFENYSNVTESDIGWFFYYSTYMWSCLY